jgi:hypothetical protein
VVMPAGLHHSCNHGCMTNEGSATPIYDSVVKDIGVPVDPRSRPVPVARRGGHKDKKRMAGMANRALREAGFKA